MVSSVGDQCADRKEGCLHLRLPVLLCDSVSVLVLLFSFSPSLLCSSLPQGIFKLSLLFSVTHIFLNLLQWLLLDHLSMFSFKVNVSTSCTFLTSYINVFKTVQKCFDHQVFDEEIEPFFCLNMEQLPAVDQLTGLFLDHAHDERKSLLPRQEIIQGPKNRKLQ